MKKHKIEMNTFALVVISYLVIKGLWASYVDIFQLIKKILGE